MQQNQTVRQGVLEFGIRLREVFARVFALACRQRLELSRLTMTRPD